MKKISCLVLIAFCVSAMSMAAMAGVKAPTKGASMEATKVVKVKRVVKKVTVKRVHVKVAPKMVPAAAPVAAPAAK
jgi:hypothetical protein